MKSYIIGDNISHYDIGERYQFTCHGTAYAHPDVAAKYQADFEKLLSKDSAIDEIHWLQPFTGVVVDKEESGQNFRLLVMASHKGTPTIIYYSVSGVAGDVARGAAKRAGGTAYLTRDGQKTGGTAVLTRDGQSDGGTAHLTRDGQETGGTAFLTRDGQSDGGTVCLTRDSQETGGTAYLTRDGQ